jgi:2-isopropylmalate synthase
MSERKIDIYDTTLRDGAQTPGVDLTVGNKIHIARKLSEVGIPYIEGGWPGANPTDTEFFRQIRDVDLRDSQIVAFGMTARAGVRADSDPGLQELLESETGILTIFGKSWTLHVDEVLRVSREYNLRAIYDSVGYLTREGRRVFYDAEHFFDGFNDDPEYALASIEAAKNAGSEAVILCDTNGGARPDEIYNITKKVRRQLGDDFPLGIHVHNDGGLANINTIEAVRAGATQVQVTVNGAGERTGNVDLCEFVPMAKLKYGIDTGFPLERLTDLSRFVELQNGLSVPVNKPYVGKNAFTHKGGVHVSAVRRTTRAYEHIDPKIVGRNTLFEHSDQGGGANVEDILEKHGFELSKNDPRFRILVQEMKEIKVLGDAQEYLLLHETLNEEKTPFEVVDSLVIMQKDKPPSANVKVEVGGVQEFETSDGDGPLNAFDLALRRGLSREFEQINDVELVDYDVSTPIGERGTEAEVVVSIDFGSDGQRWTSRRSGTNQEEAAQNALVDGYKYFILRNL